MDKIIWTAGMPRSGSMWTYNVIRDALRQAGYRVLPSHIPRASEDIHRIVQTEANLDVDPATVYVLKTHMYLNSTIPRSHFVTTVRDVRDALISWMRFMNADFDTALLAAEGMTKNCDHYLDFPEGMHTRIRYVDLMQSPAPTLTYLCQRLNIELAPETIESIVSKHEKANVAKRIADRERTYSEQIQKGTQPDTVETVEGYNNSVRIYDKDTGFQSGHVTDYKDGDWRSILNAKQKQKIHQRIGRWLERNGFE